MLTYLGLYFKVIPKEPWEDILFAQLQNLPFESFEMTEKAIIAYIEESRFKESYLNKIDLLCKKSIKIKIKKKKIPFENWNLKWERSFKPVHIDKNCVIRADFHKTYGKKHELIINPKMSFGTGHHETTFMMIKFVLKFNLKNKSILDMGCGTGILAILASKLGAKKIDAIDNNLLCIENAKENILINKCKNINLFLDEKIDGKKSFYDVIFANINLNVLFGEIPNLSNSLKTNGDLILSGFYLNDVSKLKKQCEKYGLYITDQKEKNEWCLLRFNYAKEKPKN